MAKRILDVELTADAREFLRAFSRASNGVDEFGRKLSKTGGRSAHSMGGIGRAAKRMAGVLAGAFAAREIVDFGKRSVQAFSDSEVSAGKLRAQLKASGLSYAKHAKQIDVVIQKTSQLAGLDDEDLQDAFTNIVRVTGDVNDSLKLTGLAADFARAKHMDVAKAGELVGKVAGGNTGILSRYGLAVEKGASAQEALALMQQKFAGQAETYGRASQGSMDRLGVTSENLQEKVGKKLAPAVTQVVDGLTRFIDEAESGTGAGGRFAAAVGDVADGARDVYEALAPVVKWTARFAGKHPEVGKVAGAFVAVGLAVKGIRFASKITGLGAFLGAARRGAKVFEGIWRGAGNAAGEVAAQRTAATAASQLPVSVNARAGKYRAAGRLLGGAFAAGAAAIILTEVGRAVDRAFGISQAARDSASRANPNNALDALKNLVSPGRLLGANATGGLVNRPMVMVGEEAPRHPEMVIASNPAYRARNLEYWAQAGRMLGVRGFDGGGLVGGAASLAGWLGRQGFRPTSTTGGRHSATSFHYRGMAIDYGTSLNNVTRLAQILAPYRSQFEELFIPTWAPGGGLYYNGRRVYNPGLQADHQDHIHVAEAGSFTPRGAASQPTPSKGSSSRSAATKRAAQRKARAKRRAQDRKDQRKMDRNAWNFDAVDEQLEAQWNHALTTPGTEDDRKVAANAVGYYESIAAGAWRKKQYERYNRFSADGRSWRDRLSDLDAPPADAGSGTGGVLADLAVELKRQNDFAASVTAITSREAVRALADMISGEIAGRQYQGRAMTASAGSAVRL